MFREYGLFIGSISSFVMVLLITVLVVYWMKTFHRSPIGKRMMLNTSIGGGEIYETLTDLVGHTGTTASSLRPSGKAIIDGKKIDVVAEVGMIESGVEVKVVKVEGINIVVRETGTADSA